MPDNETPPAQNTPSTDRPVIDITHSHAEGTVVHGSSRGDGVWEIARAHGLRYSRHVGIYLRGSRDRNAKQPIINALARALGDAGFDVPVDIDDSWRPAAQREADRETRVQDRVTRLSGRAERATARSTQAQEQARAIADLIPLGQPILVGHHSERRARRDQERIEAGERTARSEADYAKKLGAHADGAAAHEAAKHAGPAIMRRVDQLQADQRAAERNLTRRDLRDSERRRLQDDLDRLAEDIAHQQRVLATMAEAGEFVAWSRTDFQPRDRAQVEGGLWYPVIRVNNKTLSLEREFGRGTVPLDRITGRRRGELQWDTPHGQPWSASLAIKVKNWQQLLASAAHPSNDHDKQTRHVRYAQRLVHGLDLDAADSELAAFHPERATLDARRQLASTCLAVYQRLAAGEPIPHVKATLPTMDLPTMDLTPDWRLPGAPTVDRRVDQLRPGDLIKGVWDNAYGGRQLIRRIAGPVAAISDPIDRHESGTWIIVRLHGDTEEWLQTHRWLAVYPRSDHNFPFTTVNQTAHHHLPTGERTEGQPSTPRAHEIAETTNTMPDQNGDDARTEAAP
jgi:hypothetical protein